MKDPPLIVDLVAVEAKSMTNNVKDLWELLNANRSPPIEEGSSGIQRLLQEILNKMSFLEKQVQNLS